MYNKNKAILFRFMALVLVISLMIPVSAYAAVPEIVQPCASAYLDGYGAYVYLPGDGEVRVYFNVAGTGYMDEIGALYIELYESEDGTNWDWVDTFKHYSTVGMLSYNDDYHSSYVSYDGTKGNYYKSLCLCLGWRRR